MADVKVFPECVALLCDVVDSRSLERRGLHRALTRAIEHVEARVPSLDPLRPTVGDECQGVYATLGHAIAALQELRDELFATAQVRCGLGGGQVQLIAQGIQDGSAWWNAREALGWVEELASTPGYESCRTALRDSRQQQHPSTDEMLRLLDASLASLRPGARRSLIGLRRGLSNQEIATAEGISPSANSQRIRSNELRPLADAIEALTTLP